MYTIKAICKRSIYIKILHIVMYTCNYKDREYVLDYMLVCKFVYKIYYNIRGRSREKEKGKELHTRRIKNIAHLCRFDLKRCML